MTGTDRTVPGSGAAGNAGISGSSSTSVANRSTSTAGARKVLLVVEENHTAAQVTAGMPYLTSLGNAFAKNTAMTGVSHPSLPNYLAIAFGDTFGYTSDGLPDQYGVHGRSVFGQALTAGRTAYVYAQSSPSSCYLRNAGAYVPRHVGWPYALDERSWCRRLTTRSGTPWSGPLAADVRAGRLPAVGWFIPDDNHNAHSASLAVADAYLRAWIPLIMAGPDFVSGALSVVITFDEGTHVSNSIPFVVLHRGLAHVVRDVPVNQYGLSRALSRYAGGPPLRRASGATDALAVFGL